MSDKAGIKVFAPATVANLAVGFDILGLAFNGPGDEIKFKEGNQKGIHISSIHGDNGRLPKTLDNTAAFAAHQVAIAAGISDLSVDMEIYKKMPFGSGMGSSAASAVAGAFGMNEFIGRPFDKLKLLRMAVEGEQKADGAFHADNVAPSLMGGISLIRNNEELDYINLPVPLGLNVVLIYPHVKILTSESRGILSDQLALKQHILQSGNLAAFIAGLYKSDFDLIQRSLKDLIIEPQRKHLIPLFDQIKDKALTAGALGFSISGAGPSMFALTNNSLISEQIKEEVSAIFHHAKIEVDIYLSAINLKGAFRF